MKTKRNSLVVMVLLIAGILMVASSCFPTRARITVDSRPGTRQPAPVQAGKGTLSITLLPGSNVDWANLYIQGPSQRVQQRINRGQTRQFRLDAGKSYRITLTRMMQGREYTLTRDLLIERDKTYNLRHAL